MASPVTSAGRNLAQGASSATKGLVGGAKGAASQGRRAAGNIGRPLQPMAQRKITQPTPKGIQQRSQRIAQQNAANRSGAGKTETGTAGTSAPGSSVTQSLGSIGDQIKSQGVSYLSLVISLATFNLLTSVGILFFLWASYIGSSVLSIAQAQAPKPMPLGILALFTFVYAMELMLLFSLIVMVISLAQDLLNIFPAPLNTLFKSFFGF